MEVGLADAGSGLGFTAEDLVAESKARMGTPAAPAGGSEQPSDAEAAGEGTQEASIPAETPEAPKPDLSWLPDEVRSDFESAPDEWVSKLEKLKGGFLRQADYTRKTQELAAQRKEAEAAREKAALWDQILSDPNRSAAVLAILEGKQAPKPATAFDWTTATSEEIDAEVERRAEAKARAATEKVFEERITRPVSKAQSINAAVGEYLKGVDGLSDDQRVAAFRATIDRYGEAELLALDPAVVVKLVEPEARALAAEARLAALTKSTPDPKRVSRATSLPGTGSVAPAAKPKVVPPSEQTDEDKLNGVARSLSSALGQHVTAKDIEALIASQR